MNTKAKILENLIQNQDKLDFVLQCDNASFHLKHVRISKEPTPISKPATRGGVYFSDTEVYKIKGSTNDLSIIPLFSKMMLGPNTDFKELEIRTVHNSKKISIFVNLTNSMQSSSAVELNMIIVRIEINPN